MDKTTLAEIFAEQADWRDGKAAEYPDDDRNVDAAKHLRMLAASSADADDRLVAAAAELVEDAPDIEAWNEMLRTIGFSYFAESAQQFLNDFIRTRTSGGIA
ncbi:hypothetical protein [Shinella sp. JR1-6]|uniref:hypothetical protein n=1 Tax=Shinella sp. JR1-6 TaxID=2527671 RepID=UPI00102D3AEE|nr:hypothetical protein [Shinella sp. JR1-6]TAA63117.1 hypothetical protein EXZ48_05235 [Shinella sp. JR1-6]